MFIFACFSSLADTKTSTKTVTVGQTFEVNPVSLSGISSGKGVLSGSATFPSTDGLSVSPSNHSVTIVAAKSGSVGAHNGISGSYTTYSVKALKPGTYVVTGSATSCLSYTSKMESIYWTTYSVSSRASGSFTCTITVVDVTSISIPSSLSLTLGSTYQFSPIITDSRATTTLNWQSSKPDVATITSSGKLSAKSIGTTVISCTASNGVSASCTVTVTPVLCSAIELDLLSSELITGESLQLAATVSPSNATSPTVTWRSSNPSVATVDVNGLVTAIAPGKCNIIAATTDGSNLSSSCLMTVLSDVLYTNNVIGVPSGTLILPIQLRNSESITGLQFELKLPNGVTVATETNGKLTSTLSDRVTDQSITGSLLSNGNYQFVIFSATSSAISGSEGTIAYVTLNIGEDLDIGDYEIGVMEVELTTTNGESLHHKNLTSKLILTEAMTGDINGDNRVTVTDAVGIVNFVLRRPPSVFISKAADVNNDGNITISDAVNIINIVLNK